MITLKVSLKGFLLIFTTLVLIFSIIAGSKFITHRNSTSAFVDKTAGVIKLPLSDFSISTEESAIIQAAQNQFMNECFEVAGYDVDPLIQPTPEHLPERRYGLWQKEPAAKDGYALPEFFRENNAGTKREPQKFSEDDRVHCGSLLAEKDFGSQVSNYAERASFVLFDSFIESDNAKVIIRDWRTCLTAVGIETSPGRDGLYALPGASGRQDSKSIQIAIEDVDCKDKTNLVQRMARLEAALQQDFIEKNLGSLASSRKMIDQQVSASRQYLRSNGD